MKVSQLLKTARENLPIKILCLVAATLLYLFNSISTVEKKSFVVPVEIIENGAVMQIGSIRKNVTAVVRLTHDDTSAIHANQIHASINLDSITESGNYSIPVNIELDESLLEIDPLEIKVKPEVIDVKVEKKDLKFVPIEVSFIGEPEHGYYVADSSVEPSTLEIIGPQNSVRATEKIYTERVDLNGVKRSFEAPAKIRNFNTMLSVSEGTDCTVSVKIEPITMEKKYDQVPVIAQKLSEEFELNSELPKLSLVLKGPMPSLENYNIASNTIQADLSVIMEEGTYDIPLKFFIPGAFNLVEKSAETVSVSVIRRPVQEAEKEETNTEE